MSGNRQPTATKIEEDFIPYRLKIDHTWITLNYSKAAKYENKDETRRERTSVYQTLLFLVCRRFEDAKNQLVLPNGLAE